MKLKFAKVTAAAFIAGWIGILAVALLGGCTHNPPPTPAPLTLDAGAATCAELCEHRSRLGCSSAEPTPGGRSCLDVCRNATDPAGPIQWDLGCRVQATDCAEARCP